MYYKIPAYVYICSVKEKRVPFDRPQRVKNKKVILRKQ